MTTSNPSDELERPLQDVQAGASASASEPKVVGGPLAGDPAMVGVPTFVAGSVALGLTLIAYVPESAHGAALPIIIAATGLGQVLTTIWSAALGQSAVASIFGIFSGFWLSYSVLLLGLDHGWWGISAAATTHAAALFDITWLAIIVLLTLATLRLPAAFTLLFVLVDVALALVLASTLESSAGLERAAGIVVFAFAAVGAYIFVGSSSVATGGSPLPLGRPVIL